MLADVTAMSVVGAHNTGCYVVVILYAEGQTETRESMA